MEVAGLVVGVAGLVGTFTACVECFELVHVGKNLGTDYETATLKLDHIRLRFTRWGDAVGIQQEDDDIAGATVKSNLSNPQEEFPLVERTIGQILELFRRSLDTSNKMRVKSSKGELEAASSSTITNKTIERLHVRMRELALVRQKKSSLIQKASWAIYRKRDLNELIEDLTDLVTCLTDLVPPKRQEELCLREVADMDKDEDVAMLDTVLAEPIGEEKKALDGALKKIVEEIINERRGPMDTYEWKRSHIAEGAQVHQGRRIDADYTGPTFDRPARYTVEDSTVGKNSTFSQGDHYRVKK